MILMPEVFTIIVSYNGAQWLNRCLESLLQSEYNTKIIVVDNASQDESCTILEQYSNKIEVIKNSENLGFGKANNIGIKKAMERGAAMVFLLNQDAYVFKDTIKILVEKLQQHPYYGIVAPLQLNNNGTKLDDAFEKYVLRSLGVKKTTNILNKQDNNIYPSRFVNAAAWLIPKKCIEKVGYFHEVFSHYGEDNNYSSRVQYHKLKIGIVPIAKVIHDRTIKNESDETLLLRKIRTVPLYTLLDIRKPFFLAHFLAKRKLSRLIKKLNHQDVDAKAFIEEQKKWFNDKKEFAKNIRHEMKSTYVGIMG